MPNHEEHCRHTKKLYGVRADDVHTWMDAPSAIYGSSHRWTRHDLALVPKKFLDKYGEELAKQIMLDHILLDRNSEPAIRLEASEGRVVPALEFKKSTHVPLGAVLASLIFWIISLFIVLKVKGQVVYVWAVLWASWWLFGLGWFANTRSGKLIKAKEKEILEEHK